MKLELRWPDRAAWVTAGLIFVVFMAGSVFGYRLGFRDGTDSVVPILVLEQAQ